MSGGKGGVKPNFTMHSQREKRERSAESANSGGVNNRGSQGYKPKDQGNFMDPPTKYNNLMLSNKYATSKNNA